MPNGNPEGTVFTEGVIYTETVVYAAPPRYASEAPYQLAIVDGPGGQRITARILFSDPNSRATIGEAVTFVEEREGVRYFRPSASRQAGDPQPQNPLI